MRLSACRWRRDEISPGDPFSCAHPQVHIGEGRVTAAVCFDCQHREELALSEIDRPFANVVADGCLAHAGEGETRGMSWSVGMTTAPRIQPTLKRSLQSIVAAGWRILRLFAEPQTKVPDEFGDLPISWRGDRLGAFPNWYLGLSELFLREPLADAYLMCQDDALFAEGARDYLERCLWPAATVGVVSIYTPTHWSTGKPRGFHVETHGWESWGALAYIFSNQSLRALLADPLFISHRHHGAASGERNIDSVVGAWCEKVGLPYFVHVPSLVQHIGETSTIWSRASASGPRFAADFVGCVVQTPQPAALSGGNG